MEAQEVLECAPSAGGDRRSNSLDPDGAESADGSKARARTRAYSILGHVFFRDAPFSQAILSARRRRWRRRLRWEGLRRATPRWATPQRATLRFDLGSA
eukprot:scaffold97278_cov48-Phaeocystis_antarctica.AAC.2